MSVFKKAMNYLGLGDDDAYDDYDAPDEPDAGAPRSRSGYQDPLEGTVRTIPPGSAPPSPRASSRQAVEEPPAITIRSRQPSTVRTVSATAARGPYVVRPRRFDQAQEVADKFKEGQPVIVNLQEVDRDLSRRLIDFASGLCYGLGGSMERVAQGVYLLAPANVSVSAEERRSLAERGYDE